MFRNESRHSADDGGDEETMRHMPSGDHSATQLSHASEVYRDKCGFLLKRSGGKHSSKSPRGMTKAFSFGQLTCAPLTAAHTRAQRERWREGERERREGERERRREREGGMEARFTN